MSARSPRSPIARQIPCPPCPARRQTSSSTPGRGTMPTSAMPTPRISAGLNVVYGITANNNPTVQDLWNTTPAWSFPYAVSSLAGTPGASTMIEGAFAARVGGVGGYTMINDLLYMELTATGRSGSAQQNSLGMNPFDGPGLFGGVAPYWRVALEPHWGQTFADGRHVRNVSGCASVARSKFRDGNDRHVSPIGQIHRHRLRLAISVSGRQLLGDVARQLYSRVSAARRRALRIWLRPIRPTCSTA